MRARSAAVDDGIYGILFVIDIDPTLNLATFADITRISYFDTEDELLFSMHTIFYIEAVIRIQHYDRLFEVILSATGIAGIQLQRLAVDIYNEMDTMKATTTLANLFLHLQQAEMVEQIYKSIKHTIQDSGSLALWQHRLGLAKMLLGDQDNALQHLLAARRSAQSSPVSELYLPTIQEAIAPCLHPQSGLF